MTSPQTSAPALRAEDKVEASSHSVKMTEPETKKPADTWLSPQLSSYFIAGGIAGAASRTVVSPLERLKIIQYVSSLSSSLQLLTDCLFASRQVQPSSSDRQYKGVWSSLVRMWREEGFKGFMRGNGINCLRIIPYRLAHP